MAKFLGGLLALGLIVALVIAGRACMDRLIQECDDWDEWGG